MSCSGPYIYADFQKGGFKTFDFRYNAGEGEGGGGGRVEKLVAIGIHIKDYRFICSCGWCRLFINASIHSLGVLPQEILKIWLPEVHQSGQCPAPIPTPMKICMTQNVRLE